MQNMSYENGCRASRNNINIMHKNHFTLSIMEHDRLEYLIFML